MSALGKRFKLTFEITISKLLPAGFGWQAAATVGSNLGLASTSGSFAVLTGVGDGLGVGFGHLIYKISQRAIVRSINKNRPIESKLPEPALPDELQTAILLGSAAFCSGTVWQPVVNAFGSLNFPFDTTFAGTGIICAGVFFIGLRAGRLIYGQTGILPAVATNSYQNLKSDAWLSVAIGGGSACFVGTDYNLLGNPLKDYFGIQPTDSALLGCARAGASTAFGYFALQSVQNVILSRGKNYLDPDAFAERRKKLKAKEDETAEKPKLVSLEH